MLALRRNIAQQAGQFPPGNGRIDAAAIRLRAAKGAGMIGFLQVCGLQQTVDMGILRLLVCKPLPLI